MRDETFNCTIFPEVRSHISLNNYEFKTPTVKVKIHLISSSLNILRGKVSVLFECLFSTVFILRE